MNLAWHSLATWGRRWGMELAFVCSAAAFALAPLALDGSYSWIEHTTSEAGAQGVEGAWIARTGFLFFALGVGLLTFGRHRPWTLPGRLLHGLFALCMIGVATYSSRSWIDGSTFDTFEDALHSVAATLMGFAFAFGVLVATVSRQSRRRFSPIDGIAVAASVVLPVGMTVSASYAGVLQRVMFGIAYVWYGREAWKSRPMFLMESDAEASAVRRSA